MTEISTLNERLIESMLLSAPAFLEFLALLVRDQKGLCDSNASVVRPSVNNFSKRNSSDSFGLISI